MAIYKKTIIPYNSGTDLKKLYPERRTEQEFKGALISNALLNIKRVNRDYCESDAYLKKLFEAHNNKIRTKSIEKITNIINLWLFQTLNYE